MISQFYVEERDSIKFLSWKLFIRSNDMFLGAPFNIASYALLTSILAYLTGMKPDKLYYDIGNCHLYVNHIDQIKTQLTRSTRSFPELEFTKIHKSIDDFNMNSFKINNYHHHPKIKGDMAV
jgi:thymidylate synthase